MKHKNILLLDINDTLDDGRTTEELESWAFDDFFIRGKRHIPGVAIPKEWIERFWDFLREYHDRIIPIFWTAVWVRSQERFVHEVLKAPVYAFSTDFKAGVWELLVPWKTKVLLRVCCRRKWWLEKCSTSKGLFTLWRMNKYYMVWRL